MPLFAVTVVGHDGPGIIADVTGVLAELGGNIEDSSMTLLRGHFAMTLIVAAEGGADSIATAVTRVTDTKGLLTTVREVPPEPDLASDATHYVLRVHGGDQPGIVSAVTKTVASYQGNITDLTTRLTGNLYVLIAEVDLPASSDAAALSAELANVARSIGVDVSFGATTVDVL